MSLLTKNQFKILEYLICSKGEPTQRAISISTGISLGTVNATIRQLTKSGFISNGAVTETGYACMENYRVKRAVFIAAGFGSRLMPFTLNTPKPLLRVKGSRIIDSLLDAVVDAGIEEIYIVRGYLAEQFDQLLYKYPNIKFIENPEYKETNNISSAVRACGYFENAYVFESDILLHNKSLITRYQYSSNYLGVPVKTTNDWCFSVENGRISGLAQGGIDCWHMFGISYWDAEDGEKLKADLKRLYDLPGGRERFWDAAPLQYFSKGYNIAVRECTFDDIVEIDTVSELSKIDSVYSL